MEKTSSILVYLRLFSSKRFGVLSSLRGEAAIAKTLFRSEYGAFAEQLRKMRVAAGLTQEELAAKMNSSQRFVSRCESRERRIDFFELMDWCQATGVSLSDFLEEMETLFPHISTGKE